MVDEPAPLGPEARAELDAFRRARTPDTEAVERALRRTLDAAASREAPRRRTWSPGKWTGAAAALLLLLGGAGLAAAAMLPGSTSRLVATHPSLAALTSADQDAARGPATAGRPVPAPGVTPSPPTEEDEEDEEDDAATDDDAAFDDATPPEGEARSEAPPPPGARAVEDARPPAVAREGRRGAANRPEAKEPPQAAPSGPKAPASDTLDEERELLARAQRALTRGDDDRALTYTTRHAARFPEGTLTPERLTIQAVALCRGGDLAAGAGVIDDLRTRAPGSPGLRHAQESCSP